MTRCNDRICFALQPSLCLFGVIVSTAWTSRATWSSHKVNNCNSRDTCCCPNVELLGNHAHTDGLVRDIVYPPTPSLKLLS
ncbi:hypothetical protein BDY21DRAFT_102730 [Lineolata rhizophorae]|uniref:Uncharacterized protein n=1 Tax=Lineolata rhizophorae TaxID=578093 RepID=A0A6A6NRK7_9PEZI|nr:hypothetical protein BDY21DRAFT_102730 [Lineolata rhizophorae]